MTIITALLGYFCISIIASLVIGRFLSLSTQASDVELTVIDTQSDQYIAVQPTAAVGD